MHYLLHSESDSNQYPQFWRLRCYHYNIGVVFCWFIRIRTWTTRVKVLCADHLHYESVLLIIIDISISLPFLIFLKKTKPVLIFVWYKNFCALTDFIYLKFMLCLKLPSSNFNLPASKWVKKKFVYIISCFWRKDLLSTNLFFFSFWNN